MNCKDMNIAVVCGGDSSEREVSLRSGKAVFEALKRGGFNKVTIFDLKEANICELLALNPDIAFLALHGKGGEDGCIQGVLELARIPYTGSDVISSASCMNKIRTKELVALAGLPTPKYLKLKSHECENRADTADKIITSIGLPVVLKSPCEGSSIGVYILKEREELIRRISDIFDYGDTLLAEEFVDGVELTLPILGNDIPTALPIIEITSENEFYDFESKYTKGMCHHIIPARISNKDAMTISDIGIKAYKTLGCSGLSRIDFILDKNKGPMLIEINTLPGMTEMSLFPDSARYAGISFEALVEKIVMLAIDKFAIERENR